jgi:hypothetical protein
LPQGVHSRSHQPPQPAPIPQHAVSAEWHPIGRSAWVRNMNEREWHTM